MRQAQEAAKKAPKYDRHCLSLSFSEIQERLQNGEAHVVRLKVPENETIVIHDVIKGDVNYHSQEIDDQVLMKSDGFPTYHLAVVVDDHLMNITHVTRGDEWLPSTPKHIILYQYFGWDIPVFAHFAPILAPGGKKKLSKREGSVSVDEFKNAGYLPEALINYLVLLGWNPGTTQEIFSLKELIDSFSLDRCQKAGAVFDPTRLKWVSSQYMKAVSPEHIIEHLKPLLQKETWYKEDDAFLQKAVPEIQVRSETLQECISMLHGLYERLPYTKDLICNPKMKVTQESALQVLEDIYEKYKELNLWEKASLQEILLKLVQEQGFSNGQVFWPLRAVLSGTPTSAGAFEIAYILEKEETLKRIEIGIEKIKTL